MRMLAAGTLGGEVQVIGGWSNTWGNIRDLKKIEDKIVITNVYHLPRLKLLDPELKIITAEQVLGIPYETPRIEIIKYYITKWLQFLF